MMIEHKCHKGHSVFSTREGVVQCTYTSCRLESHPVYKPPPKPVVVFEEKIVPPKQEKVFAGKSELFCECGKEKSLKASHCMTCARLLVPPPKRKFQVVRKKADPFDPIKALSIKIHNAQRNIERWETMRVQYLRMREEMEKKKTDGMGR